MVKPISGTLMRKAKQSWAVRLTGPLYGRDVRQCNGEIAEVVVGLKALLHEQEDCFLI